MAEWLDGLLNSPFFGLGLSAAAWCVGVWLQKRTGWVLCNPLLIAGLLIIALLAVFDIPLEKYNIGGDLIKLMLGPVTAVLALNIYRQREILREHFLPVLAGCLAGSVVSLLSVLALCQVFQMEDLLTAPCCPKASPPPSRWASRRAAAASRGSPPPLWQWPVSPARYALPCLPSGSTSPTRWRRGWPSARAVTPWGPLRPWRSVSSRAP